MLRRRTVLALLTLLAVGVLPACGGGGGGSGSGESRTVLVDYNHDEFASNFLAYFPRSVTVHPGDEVVFKQAWTGEPHNVVMGTLVDDFMKVVFPLVQRYDSEEEAAAQDPEGYAKFREICTRNGELEVTQDSFCPVLPDMASFSEGLRINQNGAQPCFLDSGIPPLEKDKPCPKRAQPAFNGRQTYYNSGYIHYEGDQSNTFRLPLSNDIKPGDYQYYCNLHGPGMSGAVKVVAATEDIPSQNDVDRQARREIDRVAEPLLEGFEDAKAGKAEIYGQPFKGNLAGYFVESEETSEAFISEFIPNPIRAKVGEKVTWYVSGHTVSFHVPRYFPQLTVAENGRVTFNPRAVDPVNSPRAEPPEGGPEESEGPPQPAEVDAGEWDGRTFISSGVPDTDTLWSLTFTRPGKYKYACLIHPRMVGEVIVSG